MPKFKFTATITHEGYEESYGTMDPLKVEQENAVDILMMALEDGTAEIKVEQIEDSQ